MAGLRAVLELRKSDLKLLDLASRCAEQLDLWHGAVRAYLQQAAWTVRLKLMELRALEQLPAAWLRAEAWSEALLRNLGKPKSGLKVRWRQCQVEGCSRKASRRMAWPDAHGLQGWRCDPHGGRKPCDVCGRPSDGRRQADNLGPAGNRCYQHGARRHLEMMALPALPGVWCGAAAAPRRPAAVSCMAGACTVSWRAVNAGHWAV